MDILTITQAGWLGDLIRGVERGHKMRYYPIGADGDASNMILVLRAFTYDGGGFYPRDADIRESFVWCSGFTERWIKVCDLLTALDNAITADAGMDAPMAMIEEE